MSLSPALRARAVLILAIIDITTAVTPDEANAACQAENDALTTWILRSLITCTRPFARSAAQGFPSARLPSYTRGQTRVETTRAACEVQFSSSVGLAMIG